MFPNFSLKKNIKHFELICAKPPLSFWNCFIYHNLETDALADTTLYSCNVFSFSLFNTVEYCWSGWIQQPQYVNSCLLSPTGPKARKHKIMVVKISTCFKIYSKAYVFLFSFYKLTILNASDYFILNGRS